MKRIALAMLFVVSLLPLAAHADDQGANKFVQNLSSNALAIIKDGSLNDAEKQMKLEDMFKSNVDTAWMSNFVLGRYLKQAEPAQKQRYAGLYQEYLVRSYVPRFREYNGGELVIQRVSPTSQNEYTVQTLLKNRPEGKPDVRVDYRLLEKNGSYSLIDVIGEGVSLITTQRTDFGSVVSQKGIDAFLDMLEKRVNKLRSGTVKNG